MILENPFVLVTNPRKLKTHSWVWLALSAPLVLIGIIFIDEPLSQFFGQEDMQHIWLAAREITNVGLGEHYFGFCLLSLIFCYYIRPRFTSDSSALGSFFNKHDLTLEYLKTWTWNLLASLLTAGIALRILKFIFGRQRPHVSNIFDAHVFHFFQNHWDYQSFPSGHAQVMFTVATLLVMWDPKRNYFIMWSWIWFAVALFFAATRIATLDHFFSDFVFGSIVGHLGALWGVHLMQKYSKHKLVN